MQLQCYPASPFLIHFVISTSPNLMTLIKFILILIILFYFMLICRKEKNKEEKKYINMCIYILLMINDILNLI